MAREALSRKERGIHLLSRFAYGARPGDLDMLLEQGESGWLEEQLTPGAVEPNRALTAQLKELETLSMTAKECREFTSTELPDGASQEERRKARELRNIPKQQLMTALIRRPVERERQLEEVMSDFWRNHFNVSFTKGGQADLLISDYDRTVIRENALGSFPTMLMSSAKHPAMLHYLDNHLSRKPPTKQELANVERRVRRRTGSRERGEEAAAIASQRGLNENYARELMELHTLGVDNYYKQKDVIVLAETLTGWTFDGGRAGSQAFVFRGDMHVEGDKRLLGKIIKEKDDPLQQGEAVVKMLAEHKGTAEFIAMKLVRFFVSDVPPKALVKAVAKTYRKTKGSILDLLRTIIKSDEFWARENYRTKFKTPYEFLMSALRATQADIQNDSALHRALREMGQPIYHCDDPTGYYDTAEAWLDPGVMALRWEFAIGLAANKVRGVEIAPDYYDSLPQAVPRLWQHYLTERLLPTGAGKRTRNALSTVTNEYLTKTRVADARELGPHLVGLLIGSPEFQQQ